MKIDIKTFNKVGTIHVLTTDVSNRSTVEMLIATYKDLTNDESMHIGLAEGSNVFSAGMFSVYADPKTFDEQVFDRLLKWYLNSKIA